MSIHQYFSIAPKTLKIQISIQRIAHNIMIRASTSTFRLVYGRIKMAKSTLESR